MNNYAEIFDSLVQKTNKYIKDNNLKCMVLGISGGLDSTVTAAICHEVEKLNNDVRFIGVNLPCSSNTVFENDSANMAMKAFCKDGNYWTENLQKEYQLMKSTCELHVDSTDISQGNIKARLRMIYLYNIASVIHGIVMDTDNLTEHHLGFFTIHGDVGDLNPLGNLWKHEIYELANWLKDHYNEFTEYVSPDSFYSKDEIDVKNEYARKVEALSYALNITPTDGNGVNNFGDMGQIAPKFVTDNNIKAYTKVDDIIKTYIDFVGRHPEEYQAAMEALYTEYGYDIVVNIIKRIKSTQYKRVRLPIVP